MCNRLKNNPANLPEYRRLMELPYSFNPTGDVAAEIKANSSKPKDREVVMCQNCGSVLIIGGMRLTRYRKIGVAYCDRDCAGQDRSRLYRNDKTWNEKKNETTGNWPKSDVSWADCKQCGKRFAKRGAKQCCSAKCQNKRTSDRYELLKEKQRNDYLPSKQSGVVRCEYCEKTALVESRLSKRKFCSKRCSSKAARHRREHWERTNGPKEYIDIEKLAAKHKGKCVRCNCKVTKQAGSYDPKAATIDHIVPLSAGGWHSWSNVQLMCHQCNSVKSAQVEPGTQLMLRVHGEQGNAYRGVPAKSEKSGP